MNHKLSNGITATITFIPKKNKTDNNKYSIYLGIYIYQNGVKQGTHSISTGVTINCDKWQDGTISGKGTKDQLLNDYLRNCLDSANDLLIKMGTHNFATCKSVLDELKLNAKTHITGKAPRGLKSDFISKLKQYDYAEVLSRYLAEKELSKDRKRNYERTIDLLNEYFQNNTPTMNNISTKDLEGFKDFMNRKFKKPNTSTTYLAQIAAVFKYSVKLGVLQTNPIPESFRGSFRDGNREVLSESECIRIMSLDDNLLSHTQKVAKYSLLVQLLTGIGYKDLKYLKPLHLRFDSEANQYYIDNTRTKTTIRYVVNLTQNAKHHVDKLLELTGTQDQLFKLPSIEYATRLYKVIGKKAGVKTNINTYTLRHTFSVNFMDSGGRLEDLQVRLGHTDIKTTQIYGKISAKRNANTTRELEANSKIHQLQVSKLKAV